MREVKGINELFLCTVLVALGGSYLYQMLGFANGDYFITLLYSQFIIILPTLLYIIKNKMPVAELLRFRKIKLGTVFLTILFAFLIMPLLQEISLISMLFAKNTINSKMEAIIAGKPFILSLLVIAGVPALLEESVYRGAFFNLYSRRSPLKAVFVSALFFGLMHLNFNQFSYAFIMGMIFCIIVEGTDSIFSSMIIHFTINGCSVVLMYVVPYLKRILSKMLPDGEMERLTADVNTVPFDTLISSIIVYGVIAIFTTSLAVLVYIAIVKHEGRWDHVKNMFRREHLSDKNEKSTTLVSGAMVAAIVICLVYMVANELM